MVHETYWVDGVEVSREEFCGLPSLMQRDICREALLRDWLAMDANATMRTPGSVEFRARVLTELAGNVGSDVGRDA